VRFCQILVCIIALCWLVGCSRPLQSELAPAEVVHGPPPSALLGGAYPLAPLVVDWGAVDGSVPASAPRRVDWTTVSDVLAEVVLQSSTVPVRVTILGFAHVDGAGIPRGVARERPCGLRLGQAYGASAECVFVDDGDRIIVLLNPGHEDRYVVVQAVWLASDARQVSESWGLHFSS
jgi:hypothetical protein